MIGLVDLGIGNIRSVEKAINELNFEYKVISTRKEIANAEKLILPGVGSFLAGSQKINDLDIKGILRTKILDERIPFLGICLGMQLLATTGTEGGVVSSGLDVIQGVTSKIKRSSDVKLPHIGWNSVKQNGSILYQGINDESCFYFVHGFEYNPKDADANVAYVDYHGQIVASIEKERVFGTQFHPEKSQQVGLKLLKNFLDFK